MRKKMNFQKLNPWLVKKTKSLMEQAETKFMEPQAGEQKKEWVTTCLQQALDKVDVAKIPNWIEDPLKDLLVDFLIEIVWHLLYSKEEDPE
jgi:hypothetical protein